MKNKIVLALLSISFSVISVNAQTLTFDDVMKKSIDRSYDLKKANIDIKISKEAIRSAKSDYYPNIKAGVTTEYDRDLTGGTSSMTPVGDTILLNNSLFQNYASIGLNYNVYDFGVRKQKVIIAKKDSELKNAQYTQNIRDIKLNVANTYNEALLNFKELKSKESLLAIDKEIFSIQEKLYDAGRVSKVEVANASIKIARLYNDIDDTKILLNRVLSDLSVYTQEDYKVDDIEIQPIDDGFVPISLLRGKIEADESFLKESPEYKVYKFSIEKKEAELKELKKELLPQFAFSSNYYWYGSDQTNYVKSYSDLGQRSLSFRLSSTLPIFDGFKNNASQKTAQLEIEKLKTERDQKIYQLRNMYKKIANENELYDEGIQKLEDTIEQLEQSLSLNERLNKEQLIDTITLLNLKEELVNKKLDFEKQKINKSFSNYRLKVLSKNT